MTVRLWTSFLPVLLLFTSIETRAIDNPENPVNCAIVIHETSRSGTLERIKFKTCLPTKAHCQRLAEIHNHIFEPDKIALKRVYFRWLSGVEVGLKRQRD